MDRTYIPTRRKEMIALLESNRLTAKNLAETFRVEMKYILDDLKHIAQTVKIHHKKLHIDFAVCNYCGFAFKDRERFSRPTKCPECRSEDITEPAFYIK